MQGERCLHLSNYSMVLESISVHEMPSIVFSNDVFGILSRYRDCYDYKGRNMQCSRSATGEGGG